MPTAKEASDPTRPARTSWARRLSHPTLPTFPHNIPNLRAALLGYISEVEDAIRERLSSVSAPDQPVDSSGTSSKLQVISDTSSDDENLGSSSISDQTFVTSPNTSPRRNANTPPPDPLEPTNDLTLLRQLNTLREDVLAYLPNRLPAWSLNQDWLASLPSRLRVVDAVVSVPGGNTEGAKGKNKEEGNEGNGALDAARGKVLELVQSFLPAEDWAGWHRLGWSEGGYPPPSSPFHDDAMEDEEDEPEYLFPNRTPASAQAVARRRIVRSKSLGASSVGWRNDLPILTRSKTTPNVLTNDSDETDLTLSPATEAIGVEPEDMKRISDMGMGPTVAEALEKADDGRRLIGYEDLPFVWRNNEHIITGYRFIPMHANTGPIPLIKSAFGWHNETVNIQSHFVPTIILLLLIPIMVIHSPLPDAHWLDTAILAMYFLAAVACLSSSASWHVLSGSASRGWFEWGACVDYIGISWLISASFFTVVYNGFYCHPTAVFTWGSINLFCGALGSYLPFQKWFNERKHKMLISFCENGAKPDLNEEAESGKGI
ncbi:hypothetical protein M231_04646 [Tremella mesenterica]|uniref:Uncharacterized protein n=1 Tax=Tremella mesenterica TaxID=5217 RepID=A0A4V1M3U5_TREME|nr:hypothetical protein M231_04646 [Tremella mesenterica]